jgi:predicted metal-dependent peptidase
LKPKNVDWKKILEKIVKRDNYDPIDDQWMKPNRKLYTFYPQLILPTENETIDGKDAYKTLVSIDASGSITDNMLDSAASIICSLPEIIQYEAISWDTQWYVLDTSKFKKKDETYKANTIPGRGGTDLSCTMNYLMDERGWKSKYKTFPDLVVIITDGEGPMELVPKELQSRFVFLMTAHHNKTAIMKACPKGMIVETEIE